MTKRTDSTPGPAGILARLILALYPPRLRRKYGAEMETLILARLERAQKSGRPGAVAGVWWRALKDLAVTASLELTRRPVGTDPRNKRKAGVGALVQDIRYAARRLVRAPGFSLGAVVIMAIAIGATTAVFAIVSKLMLAPLPYGEADRVVNIYQDSDEGDPNSTSFPAYRDMAARHDIFSSVAATSPDQAALETDEGGVSVAIEFTTASFMETIGRTPLRGRWFEPAMDQVGAGYYAVVSQYAWRSRFDSDPEIVGRSLRLNGKPVTIIGVGPAGFNGMGGFLVTDFWLSISSVGLGGEYRIGNLDRREDHWYDVKARLADGVSVPQAQAAMNTLAGYLARTWPELNQGRDITVFSAADVRIHPDFQGTLYSVSSVLLVVVFLVLLLASSNLGSLLLVRGMGRTPEMAVRRAMGAAPSRVARLFLAEGLLLSVLGGAGGLILAHWLLGILGTLPIPLPLGGAMDFSLDAPVVLASIALMTCTGLFFGWAPAMHSLRTNMSGALREDQRSTTGGRSSSLVRNVLVSVQVAVSVILVVGAGVTVRSLASYQTVDTGVATGELAFIQTSFSQAGLSPEERGMILRELTERVEALPGVAEVSMATRLPAQSSGTTTTVVEGYEPPAGTGSVELPWIRITPGYFETMGIPVLEGRTYLPEDRDSDERIVVVNEALARFWGGESAVGKRIRPQGAPDAWAQVVGVVANTKVEDLGESPRPMLYYLMGETGTDAPYLFARTAGDPALLLSPLRAALREVNPQLPVNRLSTMEDHLGEALAGPRMSAGILGLFSLLALLLAAVGIYTIVSFSVAGRMGEIGIRVALGAKAGRVIRTVMGGVAVTVVVGFVAGTAVVVLLSPKLQGLLYGVKVLSFGTLFPALAVLAGAVGIASYLPARKAARVDPVEALRAQ